MTARLVSTHAELKAARGTLSPVAVVMTMGALHEGHAELIHCARQEVGRGGCVIVTDFVNPTQFGEAEDFARYPRTLEHDLDLAGVAGADLVYAPAVEEVYGTTDLAHLHEQVMVHPGSLGSILEGKSRPGHFQGMLTVVAKFLHLTEPDVAFFGQKDYQQLALITSMVNSLCFSIRVVGVPTVREEDGLARSSRNRFLTKQERTTAVALSRAIAVAAEVAAQDGARAGERAGHAVLALHPEINLDYLVITNPELGPATVGEGRVLVAANIGVVRLIDNMPCVIGGSA
ncbi:MAG: pantoate--beta-alanine ligase [Actinomycetota bacterium]|nr:pantoate--beta-alanine ligase [Actinomycetota bacterium]